MMKDLHRRVTAKERKEDEHAINAENIFDSTVAAEFNPIGIYLLKVNNRDTRTRCEMFKVNNKDTRTTPMPLFWCLYC